MKTNRLLQQARLQLQAAGCDAPQLDAELLLMFAWKVRRTDLIIRAHDPVPASIAADFETYINRRANREPLAYIVGEKEFWSRSFHVCPDVLIPRPETEHLIEAVLQVCPDRNGGYHFCDIGTGSGCIAITLACEYPNAHIVATDLSGAALQVARQNANTHQVSQRISFCQGDMFAAIADSSGFHAIISNPPYVSEAEMHGLEQELAQEPRSALTDEQDGLSFLATILRNGPHYLQPNGHIILETGLCGLPATPDTLNYQQPIIDLAGQLRGGIYQYSGVHSDQR